MLSFFPRGVLDKIWDLTGSSFEAFLTYFFIFDSGVVPETWLVSDILPIYNRKGDVKLHENYRQITF